MRGDELRMTKEEAVAFFSEYYGGAHHFPFGGVREYGHGWHVVDATALATYDFTQLTRLVIMAHDKCVRVEVSAYAPHEDEDVAPLDDNGEPPERWFPARALTIAIWPRRREGNFSERHPTLEHAVQAYRERRTL